ncbi:hypothetical protein [Devosia sediminis]|uniref:Uncharacterized protein n=1 Tax=Devosia sediminis TaxID=2798801 RepID=A0A934ITM2_9HYPH|nr:hypothetical protein [Devosia sediminis]MBJ3786548.1 hypothetical protein [Devosia sediminis]
MPMSYEEIVRKRKSFALPGYKSLFDVGLDGDYVSPLQINSRSRSGPVLVAYNWFDAPSAMQHAAVLRKYGYMPGIPFNVVMDKALAIAKMSRADIYMTQAFHLLPAGRSDSISFQDVDASFDSITRFEVEGRKVVALGGQAARACRRFGVSCLEVPHPSARIGTYDYKAELIAAALT